MRMHFIVFINVFILSTSEEKINSFVVSLLGRAQQSGTLNYYDRLRNNCCVLNGYTITWRNVDTKLISINSTISSILKKKSLLINKFFSPIYKQYHDLLMNTVEKWVMVYFAAQTLSLNKNPYCVLSSF